MKLLDLLESLRTPAGDWLMSGITHLGGETAFLAVAIFIFWCVDKHEGYYLLTVGFLGTVLNQFLKLLRRIPRPWVLDPDFTIVESARTEATGVLFPQRPHAECRRYIRRHRPRDEAALPAVGLRRDFCAGELFAHVPRRPHAARRWRFVRDCGGAGVRHLSAHAAGRPLPAPDGGAARLDGAAERGISDVHARLPLPAGY